MPLHAQISLLISLCKAFSIFIAFYTKIVEELSIPLNSYDFLAYSKKMLYLCGRETISNDISNDYSTTKKL